MYSIDLGVDGLTASAAILLAVEKLNTIKGIDLLCDS